MLDKSDLVMYRRNEGDVTQWIDREYESLGEMEFTLDGGETIYNVFEDYPHSLTEEEREIFDRENPEWANLLKEG